ncbi:DNA topoisomerase 3 [Shouchella clausii]|nr:MULTISPECIES: type IA DNA topoisomerase [Shouchella]ALA55237.1 DNA topoisomerase III [Shouchella clausii]MBU3266272.1 DNA topoisomerase 3 [Shouchella clausii]MBU3509365.1 DNA topoisomerase 3 [Shouchella clausii]MDP0462086.1 DNA topoisomerase 3 [Shouchella rhizosphaerae]MDP5267727.1 DNA topoisomerase 3 [Shouchella clausii]
MQAIIAEKSSQAQALAAPFKHSKKEGHIEIQPCETFPKGALLTWCAGHLFEIVEPHEMDESLKKWTLDKLPMVPGDFKYKVIPEKSKRFKAVKEVLQNPKVTGIIAAGDPAREGELIVQLVVKMSGVKKPMKRLWTQSLTPKSVKKAFDNLLDIKATQPLYFEAMARSYADWLIGMNASRVYTLLIQDRGVERSVYSCGRVQTPTLAMVVQREREIESFVPETFYEVFALYDAGGKQFEGKYAMENGNGLRFEAKEKAREVQKECLGKTATIAEVNVEKKKVQPPQFHSLSSLQALMNKRYKFSPKKTLELLQTLYEKSYVSYPRTDSQYVTEGEAEAFPEILKNLKSLEQYTTLIEGIERNVVNDKRYVNTERVSDHYAVIPTEKVPSLDDLSEDEKKVYDVICRSLIAAHYFPAEFSHTTIHTKVEDHLFVTKGKQMLFEGWRKVMFDDENEDEDSLLPDVQQGQSCKTEEVSIKEGKTSPAKRYTEGELITAMKNAGSGLNDKEIGKVLRSVSGLGEESTRSNIIERLKSLGYMQIVKNRVIPTQKAFILIDAVKDTVLASPELTGRWEQRLKEIGEGKASAKNFIDQSKKLAEKIVNDAKGHASSWDFNVYIEKMANEKFLGQCPKCGEGVTDKGKFYGCSAFKSKNCDFTLNKKLLGKTLSETNMRKLLEKGKTNLIKGLKGKNAKEFDAYVVWKEKEAGSIGFDFKKNKKVVKS